jgi:hypothetical protein
MSIRTTLAIAAVCSLLVACSRSPSNIHVVSTTDCGATWVKLDTGSSIPKHVGNRCGFTVALPNWPMAGDVEFKTQFAKGVLANARISYTYGISNPTAFINGARYLGKMGGSLEISADTVGSRYEMAENVIIDKFMRDVVTEITRKMDVVDANPATLEDETIKAIQDEMQRRGVTIADLAIVITNGDQTQLAIDAATAIRVYKAADIEDLGKQIMAARAGATQINVNNIPERPNQ